MSDQEIMHLALQQAKLAYLAGEVPVGAVIIKNDQVIASGHNQPISANNPIAHAELIAIEKAGKQLKTDRLDQCQIYVTLQPCLMCMAAINLAKIKKIVYGLEQKEGNHSYLLEQQSTEVLAGVMKKEVRELMQQFFLSKRK